MMRRGRKTWEKREGGGEGEKAGAEEWRFEKGRRICSFNSSRLLCACRNGDTSENDYYYYYYYYEVSPTGICLRCTS